MKGLPDTPYAYGRRWARPIAERHKRFDKIKFAWPASAIDAQRAATPKSDAVEDESAVTKRDAQERSA